MLPSCRQPALLPMFTLLSSSKFTCTNRQASIEQPVMATDILCTKYWHVFTTNSLGLSSSQAPLTNFSHAHPLISHARPDDICPQVGTAGNRASCCCCEHHRHGAGQCVCFLFRLAEGGTRKTQSSPPSLLTALERPKAAVFHSYSD